MDRQYEIAYIFSTAGQPVGELCEEVRSGFKDLDVSIENENDIGVRDFCYPIRKQTSGHYYVFSVRMAAPVAHQLDGYYKHKDAVLRHLVLHKGK